MQIKQPVHDIRINNGLIYFVFFTLSDGQTMIQYTDDLCKINGRFEIYISKDILGKKLYPNIFEFTLQNNIYYTSPAISAIYKYESKR
jgi:hypothetical protein